MTIRSNMQTRLRGVVSTSTGLGETWSYKRLTSNSETTPRTYDAAWTDFAATPSGFGTTEDYDERRGVFVRTETGSLRMSDAITALAQGDLVRAANGTTEYVVKGVGSRSDNTGTVRISVSRAVDLKRSADRGQGV